MSIADLVRRLAEAGAPPEAIAIAVEALEAERQKDAERRAKGAERKAAERRRAKRMSHDCRATVQGQAQDAAATPSSPEVFPQTPIPNPSNHIPPSPPKGGSSPTARSELSAILDAEHAAAVVEHRQRIRKPLTARAAKLLAGKFARCRDPNAAADEMIAAGWQGFEPEWLDGRSQGRQRSPPRGTAFDAMEEIFRGRGWQDEPEQLHGNIGDDQRIPAERS